jgi:outer membrane protein assembly factor BamB
MSSARGQTREGPASSAHRGEPGLGDEVAPVEFDAEACEGATGDDGIGAEDTPAAPSRGAGVRYVFGTVALFGASCLLGLTLWATVLAVAPGWVQHALSSDSMAPSIQRGDVVLTQEVQEELLGPPRVVAFEEEGEGDHVLHRIVDRNEDDTFVTKGDANAVADSTPLDPERVVGAGRILVPLVGFPAVWAAEGRVGLVAGAAGLVLLLAWGCRFALFDRYDPWLVAAMGRPRAGAARRRAGIGAVASSVLLMLAGPALGAFAAHAATNASWATGVWIGTPENLTVTATARTAVGLEWDPVNGAEEYLVQWRLGGSTEDWTPTPATSTTTMAVDGLEPETTYEFQVMAQNATVTGQWSASVTVTTDPRLRVYTGSDDNSSRTLDLYDGQQLATFTEHTGNVRAVAVDVEGNVYTGSDDSTVRKRGPDGAELWSFTGNDRSVRAIAVDADGYVYTGSDAPDPTVRKISPTGNQAWSYTGFASTTNVRGIAVDADGYVYASGTNGNVRKISPTGSGTELGTAPHSVEALAVDSQGYVYAGTDAGTGGGLVIKFNSSVQQLDWYQSFSGSIRAIAVDRDGYVYAGGTANVVHKLDPGGKPEWTYTSQYLTNVRSLAVDLDGYVYVGSDDNRVRKLTPSEGDLVWWFGHGNNVGAVAVGPGVLGTSGNGPTNRSGQAAQVSLDADPAEPFARSSTTLEASVVDSVGSPVYGEEVTFSVVSGSGSLSGPATTTTGSDGVARVGYDTAWDPETATLRAELAGNGAVSDEIAVTTLEPPPKPVWHTGDRQIATTSGSSVQVSAPGNLENGDLVLLFNLSRRADRSFTPPSGFQTIHQERGSWDDDEARVEAYYKIASNEPSSYSVSWSSSVNAAVVVGRVTGHDPVQPIDQYVGANTGDSSRNSLTLPSLTATVDDSLLLAAVAVRNSSSGNAISVPSVMDRVWFQTSPSPRHVGAVEERPSSGATGTRQFTWSSSGEAAGLMFNVRPAWAGTFSAFSGPMSTTVEEPVVPQVPVELMVVDTDESSVDLGWDAVDAADGYEIRWREEGAGSWAGPVTTGEAGEVGAVETTVDGLEAATAYEFAVRATSTAGVSGWSEPVRATTDDPDEVSAPPGGSWAVYPRKVLDDGPVAWWRFEETSGETVVDEVHGADGTVVGAELDVAGASEPLGSAIRIDGHDQAVDVEIDVGLEGGLSYAFWLEHRPTEDGSGTLLTVDGGDNDVEIDTEGSATFRFGGEEVTSDAGWVVEDAWHQYMITYDLETVRFYRDDTLYDSQPLTADGTSVTLDRIGNGPDGTSPLLGDLDEVAVYDHALSAERVEAQYQAAEVPGPDAETGEGPSADGDAEAGDDDGPAAPLQLTEVDTTSSSVELSWDAVEDADDYTLRWRERDAEAWTETEPTADTAAPVDGLDAETAYEFAVRATGADGAGDWSETLVATTGTAAPATPEDLEVVEVTDESVEVTWPRVADAESYTIRWRVRGTEAWTETEPTTATETTVDGLDAATAYELQVRADGDSGPGAWSASVEATTDEPLTIPVGTTGSAVAAPTAATDPRLARRRATCRR